MAKIVVMVRSDRGDLGIHPKHGPLVNGSTMTIEEEDFGAELFERPAPEFLSPLEIADKTRAEELGQRVGYQDPPENTEAGKPQGDQDQQESPDLLAGTRNNLEVIDHA
jgi:hypothetical protein